MQEIQLQTEILSNKDLISRLKTSTIKDGQSGISLIPFDGSPIEIEMHRKWFSDPDVAQYLDPNTPYTEDRNIKVPVEEFIDYMVESPIFAFFRIEHPQYGFIGHASMNGIDLETMSFERAITIGEKQYWRQGIGSNVGKLLLKHAKDLGFKKVTGSTHVNNSGSRKNLTNQFGEGNIEGDQINFELNF